jgi:nucleoside-diphosphate-sugar epimerase
VRNPSKLPQEYITNDRITIVQGELTDTSALAKAMKGVTSVVCLLGAYITLANFLNRSTATPIADRLSNVFAAMRAEGVKRIITLSSVGGFQRPGDYVPYGKYWLFTYVAPKTVVPGGAAEMKRIGEVILAQTDLEWTVFRVPHLNDGDAQGELEVVVKETVDAEYQGGLELSRMSLVKWVLGELEEGRWIGKTPVVGNPW